MVDLRGASSNVDGPLATARGLVTSRNRVPGTATMPAVRRLVLQFITAIQLTRLTMAFGAISDVWFVILLTRADGRYADLPVSTLPLAGVLAAGALVAIGLFAYGASLNDVLDARHDATFSPDRPIPAGRIRLGQAIIVTVAALLAAMLAAGTLGMGAWRVALLTATAILFYNAVGKHIPAFGIVAIGVVHALHMLIPNHELGFTLPVWLVMTHACVIATLVHELEDKRPRITQRSAAGALTGWLVCSGIVIALGAWRGDLWPVEVSTLALLWPGAAVAGFALVAWHKTRRISPTRAAEKLKRYGAMWQSLYGAAWLMALGYTTPATWIAAFALCGFVTMTAIKEITGLSSSPVTYRA